MEVCWTIIAAVGYEICAVIGSETALRAFTIGLQAKIVPLRTGICVAPLTDPLLETLRTDSGHNAKSLSPVFEFLYPAIEERAEAASNEAPLAYVEANYFGGIGSQMAAAWKQGRLVLEPTDENNPINQALRILGVQAVPPDDEFDTIGLGTHRKTRSW